MLPFLCLGAWLDGRYVTKSSGFCDLRCEAEQFTRNQLRYIIPHTQGEGFTCHPVALGKPICLTREGVGSHRLAKGLFVCSIIGDSLP